MVDIADQDTAVVAPPSGTRLGSVGGRAILASAVLGSALAYMSDDMLNVALPTLSGQLDANVTDVQWVINGYFITMLALMLTAGSIGDIRGHRRTFTFGVGVFVVGAVVAAASPAVAWLVVGRAVQGVGAAFLLASGLALVTGSFADEERGRAVGIYMGLTAVATAAGPALGGFLVAAISWRAVFLAPLLLPVTAAMVLARVPETHPVEGRRIDAAGALLAFVTIAAFSYAMIRGPVDWLRIDIVAAFVVALTCAIGFVVVERTSSDPMLPLELLRIKTFAGGNAVTLIAYTVSAGVFLFVVLQLQNTVGYEPAAAGAALVPLYIIMVAGSPLAGRLGDAIGARIPVVVGLCVVAGGTWLLKGIDQTAGFVTDIAPGLILFAVGLAMTGAPLTTATLGAVGDQKQGVASGVNNTVGQVAGLLMITILPAAAGLSGHSIDGPEFASGYATVMQLCALLALAAAALAAFTIRPHHLPMAATAEAVSPQNEAKGPMG